MKYKCSESEVEWKNYNEPKQSIYFIKNINSDKILNTMSCGIFALFHFYKILFDIEFYSFL